MKIGIDISQIVYSGTGVARFTSGLIKTILKYDKKNRWTFFFSSLRQDLDTDLEAEIKNKGHQLLKWKIPPTLLAFLANNIHSVSLSSIIYPLSSHLDWFITSDWTEPPLRIKKATIVHDLTFIKYPETVETGIKRIQQKRLSWVKKESQLIFADSNETRSDLVESLNIEKERISVNYPGVEVQIPKKKQVEEIRKKYNLKKPFILSVGKIEPRKNLNRLIQAFEQCSSTMELVIVGPKGWGEESKIKVQSSDPPAGQAGIKYLGFVDDTDLCALYASCLFFIYPSLWEGFGYPIIEAMKLGAAVTCSDIAPIREIAADCALLFNPNDINDISSKINIISQDADLRKRLIAKGYERSKIFAWQNYYDNMIKALTNYE